MPSMILKQLQLRRRGRGAAPSDATPPKRDLSPGPSPDLAGRTRLAQHDGASKDQAHQAAHDQVLEGLESLSTDYPEAGDLLQKFEQMWTRWMAGPSGAPGEESGEPGPDAESGPGEAGSGLQGLADKAGLSQ